MLTSFETSETKATYRHRFKRDLDVWVSVRSGGAFALTQRTYWDTVFESRGFYGPVDFPDRELRARLFFSSPVPEHFALLWNDERMLEILRRLVRMGVHSLDHDGATLRARWRRVGGTVQQLSPLFLDEVGSLLHELGRGILSVFPVVPARSVQAYLLVRKRWVARAMSFLVLGGLFVSVVIFLLADERYWPVYWFEMVGYSLPFLSAGLFLLIWAMRRFLRPLALPGIKLQEWATNGAMGLSFAVMAGVIALNGGLDASEPVRHEARIVQRWTPTFRGRQHYHVLVHAWRALRPGVEIDLPKEEYDEVTIGGRLPVLTCRGVLGLEWRCRRHLPSGD